MFGFLKRLFGRSSKTRGNRLSVDAYWCESLIKLPDKVQTPLGSRVTVVRVCVDIDYTMEDGAIILYRVQLSRGGGRIIGSDMAINVAAERTGEAWCTSRVCSESHLRDAVQRDLSSRDSRLHRIMTGKWRGANREALAQSVAEALNSQVPAEELADLIATAGPGIEITFTYTKPNGRSETRHVSVLGVSGNSIRAEDHKDGKVKNFRIDRITNAHGA